MFQHSNIYFALKSVLYHGKHVLQLIHCVHAYSNYRELVMVSAMCFSSKQATTEWLKLEEKFHCSFCLYHIFQNSVFLHFSPFYLNCPPKFQIKTYYCYLASNKVPRQGRQKKKLFPFHRHKFQLPFAQTKL